MAKESQNKNYDGQNRCRRCNRPLSDPNDNYGWWCAKLLGLGGETKEDILDSEELELYNNYLTYDAENKLSEYNTDNNYTTTNFSLPTTDWKDASEIIVRNKEAIKNAGAYYGVNPAIIAACIYTEQITNVNILDPMTDVPAYFADTSIGIGQVKISTAKMLEDEGYIQKTQFAFTSEEWHANNSVRREVWYAPAYGFVEGSREKAIAYRLTVESECVNYVAAYLRYFQDRWKPVYPEIDGRTDVLATLYNQGEEKPPHANPRPAPFGVDAKKEYYYMRQLLELD